MNISELIDRASEMEGSRSALARAMDSLPQRLNEWARGATKPDAHEIAFLARKAGLPVLETVAEIEAQLDSRYSEIWREALGKLKAAGIAATVTVMATFNPVPSNANASPITKAQSAVCILCQLMRAISRTAKPARLKPARA